MGKNKPRDVQKSQMATETANPQEKLGKLCNRKPKPQETVKGG